MKTQARSRDRQRVDDSSSTVIIESGLNGVDYLERSFHCVPVSVFGSLSVLPSLSIYLDGSGKHYFSMSWCSMLDPRPRLVAIQMIQSWLWIHRI